MTLFIQQLIEGLSSGAIYAALALAIVLIYRGTGLLNFAQGEMAMFATYFTWQLLEWGAPLLVAIVVALVAAFLGGALVERTIIRPIHGADELTVTVVTLGLFLALNSVAAWVWTSLVKDFPPLFSGGPLRAGGVSVSRQSVATLAVALVTFLVVYLVFKHTSLGLSMRAVADNPESSRLVGISVGRTAMISWGLASMLGALAGILVVPQLFLEPNVMFGVLLYAFAAAALGGMDSFGGAIVGGLAVGVIESLAGAYLVPADLKVVLALGIIVLVLVVRPAGLFGTKKLVRA
jgi:branched-chain amino acid transport system permease protein